MAFSREHYRRLANGGPDKPGDAERRVAARAIGERANAEMMERFAPLTAENAAAAIAWQEARIAELTAAAKFLSAVNKGKLPT